MFKFLENLFAKNNGNADKSSTSITMDIQFGKPTDKEVSQLLKNATAFKKINIEQSIELIKKVLTIDPKYPCHNKLISYLILAKKFDEAEELIIKLIGECQSDNSLFNFTERKAIYEIYSDFLFKKESYRGYIYYYSLSFYNDLVATVLLEDLRTVKFSLNNLKKKEIFIDKKTNKAFQETGASAKQDLFIKTFYEILKGFNFNELYKLVTFLNNKQVNKEDLEIYAIENQKEDWLLWSSKEFRETIVLYKEDLFIDKYKSRLETILNQRNS
jgi:hypothetical protein